MMIYFYGVVPYKYSSKRPQEIICHNCNFKGQTFVDKHLKYWHFMFIPFFSYKFWTQYDCVRCNSSVIRKDLNIENKIHYDDFDKKRKPPIWTFTGLLAIILIPLIYNIFK